MEMSWQEVYEMKKKAKKSSCAVKSRNSFKAGMSIGSRMKKPKGKKKK